MGLRGSFPGQATNNWQGQGEHPGLPTHDYTMLLQNRNEHGYSKHTSIKCRTCYCGTVDSGQNLACQQQRKVGTSHVYKNPSCLPFHGLLEDSKPGPQGHAPHQSSLYWPVCELGLKFNKVNTKQHNKYSFFILYKFSFVFLYAVAITHVDLVPPVLLLQTFWSFILHSPYGATRSKGDGEARTLAPGLLPLFSSFGKDFSLFTAYGNFPRVTSESTLPMA